jgi:hypothetical protein
MSNGVNHNTRNRTVILSEVEGSRKNTAGLAAGFDSLTSRSLSLRPSRPCRGFPSRSILDSARNDLNV